MGNKQVNNKTKREISYALSTYIFKRLWANRELQNLIYIDKHHQIVRLDNYSEAIRLLDELIRKIDLGENKNREKLFEDGIIHFIDEDISLINDSEKVDRHVIESILEEAINRVICQFEHDEMKMNYRDTLSRVRNDLEKNISKRVILSKDNIKDIKELVEYYVEKFNLPSTRSFNCNTFLREVFGQIEKNSKDEKTKALAEKYSRFICSCDDAGFDSRISGYIGFGLGNAISVRNGDSKLLFKVDSDNVIKKRYVDGEDYILFGRDIMIGLKIDDQGNKVIEIGRVIVDISKFLFHTILTDDKVYTLLLNHCEEVKVGYVSAYKYLQAFLKEIGLGEYYSHVYKEEDLKDLVKLINKYQTISQEEIKKYETVALYAAEWWVNAIDTPSFNADISGTPGLMIKKAADILVEGKKDTKESIEKFKQLLKKRIVGELVKRDRLSLDVDYNPCNMLSICANEAELSAIFPLKTNMTITRSEVRVSEGYGGPIQIIYNEETPQDTPNGIAKRELK